MSRLFLFITICLALFTYLTLRLVPGLGWGAGAFVAFLIGLLFVYPLLWRHKENSFTRAVRFLIHMDMGLLSFLAPLIILRDLIFLPLTWLRPSLSSLIFGLPGSLAVIALSFIALILGILNARSGPRVRHVKVPITGLPAPLDGYKIAHVSDLHVGPGIGKPYVERVVEIVRSLSPHMTVLTGDIADGRVDEYAKAMEPLKHLRTLGEALYVPGNHEYYWNGPLWIEEFKSLGLDVLLNSRQVVRHRNHEILVAGVVDPAARIAQPGLKPDARAAHGPGSDASLKILLSHHPGIARAAEEAGFHLQLSGHTHAGQFFPWTLVVRRVHEFHHGLEACGKMWVYVSPGTGSWGPPIRLGTTPEVTLLCLTKG